MRKCSLSARVDFVATGISNSLFRGPLYGVDRMSSAPIGSYRATNVPVLDIHEIVAGKMVALITRHAARDLFDAQRIIAMPDLDWTKIKAATLMIGASAKSFDWRIASPEAIGCEVGAGKLTTCLHDRYFDAFGGPAGWIESVAASREAGSRARPSADAGFCVPSLEPWSGSRALDDRKYHRRARVDDARPVRLRGHEAASVCVHGPPGGRHASFFRASMGSRKARRSSVSSISEGGAAPSR
jgi:hypothetical protein